MSDSAVFESISPAIVFSVESVVPIRPGLAKADVLRSLVEHLANRERIERDHVDSIVSALLAREQAATTGMGKGLAFPHLRSPAVESFCGAIGTVPEGVDFNSLDRLPTRLVVLVLSPFEARAQHTEILARLSALLSDHTLQYSLQTRRPAEELLTFLGLC